MTRHLQLTRARRSPSPKRTVALAACALAPAVALAACGDDEPAPAPLAAPQGQVLLRAAPVAALAALPGGALLAGPLDGGPLVRVARDGTTRRSPLRVPPVSTDGQRGLLSLLAVRGGVYASWTARGGDRPLLVGALRAGRAPRLVWRGPATTDLANGGHLALAPDGRIAVGLGERQQGRGPVGQIVSLDPAGPPSQRPRTLSRGWWNPFAFAYDGAGRLWVADNAPGQRPERLARGDRGRPADVTELPRKVAPSGLAALPGGDLALCGVVSGRLERWRRGADGRWQRVATLAAACSYGVVRLSDGRLAFAGADAVRSVRLPTDTTERRSRP